MSSATTLLGAFKVLGVFTEKQKQPKQQCNLHEILNPEKLDNYFKMYPAQNFIQHAKGLFP